MCREDLNADQENEGEFDFSDGSQRCPEINDHDVQEDRIDEHLDDQENESPGLDPWENFDEPFKVQLVI